MELYKATALPKSSWPFQDTEHLDGFFPNGKVMGRMASHVPELQDALLGYIPPSPSSLAFARKQQVLCESLW